MRIIRQFQEGSYLLLLGFGMMFLVLSVLFSLFLKPGALRIFLVIVFFGGGLLLSVIYLRMIVLVLSALEAGDESKIARYSEDPLIRGLKSQIQTEVKVEMEKKYLAENQTKESELLALQSQINPHFLYNTLDSIRGQAMLDGAEEIVDMTEALSAFFRYSISRKGNFVTLRDELWNLDNYMKIQQFRFENKFVLIKEFDCDQDALECFVPKMILQPIVENSIYHGMELLEEPGKVVLRIEDTGQKLRIQIEDSGVGIPEKLLCQINAQFVGEQPRVIKPGAGKGGIALKNVNDRIQIYFGMEYGLFIRSVVGVGTQVDITIPKEKNIQILDGKVRGMP